MRALGSHIKGTNGKSQGVVPFLKVVNDTAVAVNQGGKRKGAVCAYLETWHLDIEEFLELRKNTGDDRRRTHDMNTANWIPDLFMKRVMEGGDWTLFSPSDVPDLHDKCRPAFEEAYIGYEEKAARGELKLFKKIPALQLWRKMLSMLFETGHPWITFKDACNIRSPQQHVGVVHSSNLCTEITLNTSDTEIAVCNLGSVNLLAHMKDGDGLELDHDKLQDDDPHRDAHARQRDRHQLLRGRQGAQLQPASIVRSAWASWASRTACTCCACRTRRTKRWSSPTARWKRSATTPTGRRPSWPKSAAATRSYTGSCGTAASCRRTRSSCCAKSAAATSRSTTSSTMDWDALRARIKQHGMRNSNCVAIAPTATISNIIGVSACIEPTYQNLYVKSNLSGEFTVVNEYLVRDLKALRPVGRGDGRRPQVLRRLARARSTASRRTCAASTPPRSKSTPKWIVEAGARRQKWIDQAQSLNIYMAGASGKKLDETYKLAWLRGLKTTYYLRTLAATSAEKSTGQGGELNAVPSGESGNGAGGASGAGFGAGGGIGGASAGGFNAAAATAPAVAAASEAADGAGVHDASG